MSIHDYIEAEYLRAMPAMMENPTVWEIIQNRIPEQKDNYLYDRFMSSCRQAFNYLKEGHAYDEWMEHRKSRGLEPALAQTAYDTAMHVLKINRTNRDKNAALISIDPEIAFPLSQERQDAHISLRIQEEMGFNAHYVYYNGEITYNGSPYNESRWLDKEREVFWNSFDKALFPAELSKEAINTEDEYYGPQYKRNGETGKYEPVPGYHKNFYGATFINGDIATGEVAVEDNKLYFRAIDKDGNEYETEETPLININHQRLPEAEMVFAEAPYGTAYSWKCEQFGIMALGDSKIKAQNSWIEACLAENVKVIQLFNEFKLEPKVFVNKYVMMSLDQEKRIIKAIVNELPESKERLIKHASIIQYLTDNKAKMIKLFSKIHHDNYKTLSQYKETARMGLNDKFTSMEIVDLNKDIRLDMEYTKSNTMENNKFEGLIITELIKHGWEVAPEDISHVVIAQKSVKTFKGMDFAKIHPIIVFEGGDVAVKAEFISKGENALALCSAYIKTQDEIPVKIADFHEEIMKSLSQAFSVRMASTSKADKQKGMER